MFVTTQELMLAEIAASLHSSQPLRRLLICGAVPEVSLLHWLRDASQNLGSELAKPYHCFATARAQFLVADCCGQNDDLETFIANAATADSAVVVVDARHGVLEQTRQHSHLLARLGVGHLLLAVDQMERVDWDRGRYESIAAAYHEFAAQMGAPSVRCVPISSQHGDHVAQRSSAMPWYQGATLLEHLHNMEIRRHDAAHPARFVVQNVDAKAHRVTGSLVGGAVQVGDRLAALPAGQTATLTQLITNGDAATTLILDAAVDLKCGDLLVAAEQRAEVADQFAAHLIWLGESPLLPGRTYALRTGTTTVNAQITEIKHQVNVSTLEHVAAKSLSRSAIALCNIALDQALPFDPYTVNRHTGSFVVLDPVTEAKVGCGLINFALRRASNIHWQAMKIDKQARAETKQQRPCVLWFTGLSGSGKSTIADLVEQQLHAMGHHTMLLDGDNVRHGLNRDLGFTDEDRVENIRRVAEVARLMTDAGLITLVSFISPFRSERKLARERQTAGEFIEIFVDAPLAVCEARDPKGLYRKARSGQLPNFTGIGSPYEPPETPELHLCADERSSPETLAAQVIAVLRQREMI